MKKWNAGGIWEGVDQTFFDNKDEYYEKVSQEERNYLESLTENQRYTKTKKCVERLYKDIDKKYNSNIHVNKKFAGSFIGMSYESLDLPYEKILELCCIQVDKLRKADIGFDGISNFELNDKSIKIYPYPNLIHTLLTNEQKNNILKNLEEIVIKSIDFYDWKEEIEVQYFLCDLDNFSSELEKKRFKFSDFEYLNKNKKLVYQLRNTKIEEEVSKILEAQIKRAIIK